MIGLPCTGKSTWAQGYKKEQFLLYGEKYVIISKDLIREMYFNEEPLNEDSEKVVTLLYKTTILSLKDRFNIIIDNTHLNKFNLAITLSYLVDCDINFKVINTPLSDIIKRNKERVTKKLPEETLNKLHNDFVNLMKSEYYSENIQNKLLRK